MGPNNPPTAKARGREEQQNEGDQKYWCRIALSRCDQGTEQDDTSWHTNLDGRKDYEAPPISEGLSSLISIKNQLSSEMSVLTDCLILNGQC